MLELWGIIGIVFGGYFVVIAISSVGRVLWQFWRYINKKRIEKGIWMDCVYMWVIGFVTMLFIGALMSASVYFIKSWEHINSSTRIINFEPRRPWLEFFREERRMKNPKIFDITINQDTLCVKAIDDDGKVSGDYIGLEK